jgi:hypothetical protein
MENVRRLDASSAERLLAGEDVGFDDLSNLLAAAAAPARPSELTGEATALAAFRRATLGTPAHSRRRSAAKPLWARLASVKVAAAAVTLTATGVALAAGTGVLPTPFTGDPPTAAPSLTANRPGGDPAGTDVRTTGAPVGPGATTGAVPSTTPDAEIAGQCRAYRAQAKVDPVKAKEGPVFARLAVAAGGPDNVDAYCDQILRDPTPKPTRPPPRTDHGPGPSASSAPDVTTGPPA